MNYLRLFARSVLADLADLVAPPVCAACGATFPRRLPLCDLCRAHLVTADEAPPAVSVAYEHGGSLARAVHRAKYGADPSVAASLGALLVETWAYEGVIDAVVPVPLHPARLRLRGFNQSAELSRALCRTLGASLLFDGARRVRDTPTQTRLDRAARRRNVADAFVASPRVQGARVLLVDDVVTTGATLASLREACLAAGAGSVHAVALARAPLGAP